MAAFGKMIGAHRGLLLRNATQGRTTFEMHFKHSTLSLHQAADKRYA